MDEAKLPAEWVLCSHGRPDHQELVRRLRAALGMHSGAMAVSPEEAWDEAMEEARRLYRFWLLSNPPVEHFSHLGAGWSAAINSIDFWTCRTCGALVDARARSLHQGWHEPPGQTALHIDGEAAP